MGFLDGLIAGIRKIKNGAGAELPIQDTLQFIGATTTDDPVNKQTVVQIDASTAAGAGLAAIANLRAVGPADRVDKQSRVISADPQGRTYPNPFIFKSGSGAGVPDDGVNIIKPNDLANSDPGRHYRASPIYTANPKDFGAIGDGTTDDTTAVQAALNSGAQRIELHTGTFKCGLLTVPATVKTIVGPGTLKQKVNGANLLTIDSSTGLEISGVSFVGVGGSTTQSNNIGIEVTSSSGIRIHHCTLATFRHYSIHFSGSSDCEASANTITGAATSAVRITDSTDVRVLNNKIGPPQVTSFVIGIGVDSTDTSPSGVSDHITIRGNQIDGWTLAQSILLHSGTHFVIDGNTITDSLFGIALGGAQAGDTISDGVISNNLIVGTDTGPGSGTGTSGINLAGSSGFTVDNVVVSGNVISHGNALAISSTGGGILIGYTTGCKVFGNILRDCYGCGIALANPNTGLEIHDNKILSVNDVSGTAAGIYGVAGAQSGHVHHNRIESVNWGMRFDVSSAGLTVGPHDFASVATSNIVSGSNVTLRLRLPNSSYLEGWSTDSVDKYRLIGLDGTDSVVIDPDIRGTTIHSLATTVLTMSGLSASQAMVTDASKNAASLAYATAATASTLVERDGSGNANFVGVNLSGLSASQAVVTDGSKNLASLGYDTAATASTLVERDGSGNVNIVGANVSGLSASQAVVTDGSKNLASLNYTTANTASTLAERDASGFLFAAPINVTYTPGTTTPSVSGKGPVTFMHINNSSPTTITNFTGATSGHLLLLAFADSNTTVDRSNAALAGSSNFTSAQYKTLTLMYDGAAALWLEIVRSTNG